jgi:hypothetical protein
VTFQDEFYDSEWVPQSAEELTEAAERLEQFDTDLPPRTAFLAAKWLRSYAAEITAKARAERETPDVNEHALAFARHIKEISK